MKKISCLVLRGRHVDREILISCETLLSWDLIHETFGRETITNYVKRNVAKKISNCVQNFNVKNVKNVNKSDLFCKNTLSTNKMLTDTPQECFKLREKILRNIERK